MARPREFCMDQALENAMLAFWSHGYEATSMADLMQAMDLQKGSIYKAFGDKHSLFIAALERYLSMAKKLNQEILDSGKSPKDSLRLWLEQELKFICGQELRRGCLIVNALIERAYQDEEVSKRIKVHFADVHKLLTNKIKDGQALGEFRDDLTASELTQIITSSFIGMVALSKGPMSKSASLKTAKNILVLIEK